MNCKFDAKGNCGKFIGEIMHCMEDDRDYMWDGSQWTPLYDNEKVVFMARVLSTEIAFDTETQMREFLKDFKDKDIERVWRREMIWEDFEYDYRR